MEDVRITTNVARVLRVFLEDPLSVVHAYDVIKATGLPSGTIYPIFERLELAGWLTSNWEQIDPSVAKRPARRNYRFTASGLPAARQALAELNAQLAPKRRLRLSATRPAEGA
jgi:DNA-binding PadR family transcriptional regulator